MVICFTDFAVRFCCNCSDFFGLLRVASVCVDVIFTVNQLLQGYTLADEEEDPLIYQHRMLRSNQGETLASGPVETGPMKKLHVSTINLQKVRLEPSQRE